MTIRCPLRVGFLLAMIIGSLKAQPVVASEDIERILDQIGLTRGICVVLDDTNCILALELPRSSELIVSLQLPRDQAV